MLRIAVKEDINATIRRVSAYRTNLKAATPVALNATAGLVKDAEVEAMSRVFDRPTPYTLNSMYSRNATTTYPTATVYLKADRGGGIPADLYLNPEIHGGTRRLKRFEVALRAAGALPDGYFVVPGSEAKLDAYGNISSGLIVQILSYFRAFPENGYRANITDARKAKLARGTKKKQGFDYFVGRPAGGKLPLGIWQRVFFAHGTALRPIMIFVANVHYRVRLEFYQIATAVYDRAFGEQMRLALANSIAVDTGAAA